MSGALGALAAVLAGAGGAFGQIEDERKVRARQAALDAERQQQQAFANQLATQSAAQAQRGADLEELRTLAPGSMVRRGAVPALQGPTFAPSPLFESNPTSALSALASAAKPGALAALGAPRRQISAGDAPDRYVQVGDYYADTQTPDAATARADALAKRAREQALSDRDAEHTFDLEKLGTQNANALEIAKLREAGDDRRSAAQIAGSLRAAQIRADDIGRTFSREAKLSGEYNKLFPVENADKFASNAHNALLGVQLARQGNREGHLMAITGFLRQTHPDAVVRTNDKGMLMEAQGIPAEVQMWVRRAIGQGGILTPAALDEIERATKQMTTRQRENLAPVMADFGRRSRAAGVDSAYVARDPFNGLEDVRGGSGANVPRGTAAPSTATAPGARPSLDERAAQLKAAGYDLNATRTIMKREGY